MTRLLTITSNATLQQKVKYVHALYYIVLPVSKILIKKFLLINIYNDNTLRVLHLPAFLYNCLAQSNCDCPHPGNTLPDDIV